MNPAPRTSSALRITVPAWMNRALPLDRLSTWALAGGVCGLAAAVPGLPTGLSSVLLLAFIFLGPGSVVMQWVPGHPALAVRALVPIVGLAVVIIAISGLLLMDVYRPVPSLLVLAMTTTALGAWSRHGRDRIGPVSG